jgi:hypothetical protein
MLNKETPKKSKVQMVKEARHILGTFDRKAIDRIAREKVKRLKEERIRSSYSYEEVAEEFGIYPRTLREYVSGRRKPGIGKALTRYGFLLEKYYLDKDLNRWFILEDYQG